MKKIDDFLYKMIKAIYWIFALSSISLLLCFIFFRNISKNTANILGTIYLIIVLLTAIFTIYCAIKGLLFAKRDKTLKELLKESLSSAFFALFVIVVYSLILYHKVVIGTDYIIIIVFFIIPAFRKYFYVKKDLKLKKIIYNINR